MKLFTLLLVLFAAIIPAAAQENRRSRAVDVPTITFCDLVYNPDIFDGAKVRFRTTYLANSKVATFVDQSCMTKDKQTWAEFDGISIKASAPADIFKKLEEQVWCGKCGDDNNWRETDMLVTGIFRADDIGHGRLGKYRFTVMVTNVEEIGATFKTEKTRFALPR